MFKICNALILLFLFLDYLFSFCFSEEETKLNITENYLNNTNKTYFHLDNNLLKKKKLFFPQNLINNRLKLPKKTKKHNNHNYKIIKSNNYKYPNYLLKEINNDYIRKKLNELVRKSEYEKINKYSNTKIKEERYSEEYKFYVNKENLGFDSFYTWPLFIKKNTQLYEYKNSNIEKIIKTNPEELKINVHLCIIKKVEFKIYNPDSFNNLIINEIKTDIYQVKIFPLNHDKTLSLPYTIYFNVPYVFQLLILADFAQIIRGNLYISFNNNQILLIPIYITSKQNEYNIYPIYKYDLPKGKTFSYSIIVNNPTNNILIVKDIVHYFKKIKILWPNGISITDNSSSISVNMLQINPKSKKNIIYLNYESLIEDYEFNYIHLKINKIKFIIPVLIGFINGDIQFFPSFFNFGLCNIAPKSKDNIKKIIPLEITNYYLNEITIKNIYLNIEEKFIEFDYFFKNKKVLLKPNESINYGQLIFNGQITEKNPDLLDLDILNKSITNSIFIEVSNYTQSLIEINYSYFLINDKNKNYFISKNFEFSKREFIIKYKASHYLNLEMNLRKKPGNTLIINIENILFIKYKNPLNYFDSNSTEIQVNIYDIEHMEKERYFFFPLKLSFNLFTLIPIKLDNSNIDYLYCGNKFITFSDCFNSNQSLLYKNILKKQEPYFYAKNNIDIVIDGENKKVYFYLINENSFSKSITDIKINDKSIKLKIEDCILFSKKNKNIEFEKINILKLMKKRKKYEDEIIPLKVYKNSALKFSIKLNIFKYKGESKIIFFFKKQKTFTIEIIPNILKGTLNFTPSIISFKQGFYGLNQSKIISCKSSFNTSINITNIKSSDKRIIPTLISKSINNNNRTEVIKIIFIPEKKENIINIDEKYITYRDLFLWKEKHKLWEKLGNIGKTEINSNLTILTDINEENIQIKAFLTKPNIFEKDIIDLGLVQIGENENIFIEGFNPSDQVMSFRIVLASEEFSDINNNSMFVKNSKYQFNGNNFIFIIKCIFDLNFNSNYNDIIILEENENENIFENNKEDILEKMLFYSNENIKEKILNSTQIICKYKKEIKNKIVEEKNIKLLSEMFSNNFTLDIPIVKQMTDNKNYLINPKKKKTKKKNIILKLFSKVFFLINSNLKLMKKKKKIKADKKQTFYLPLNITEKIYNIEPRTNFKIGPIIFCPLKTKDYSVTLFIKNNLTILYPIKIKGEGGKGKIQFLNYKNLKNPLIKLENENKVIINIDKSVYLKELIHQDNISRTITLRNSGKMKMKINKISIENYGCEGYGIKILLCEQFNLRPEENIGIDIIISPNYNLLIVERKIFFYSDYQIIILNVVIKISDELLLMKNQFINYKIYQKNILMTLLIVLIGKIIFQLIINEFKNKFEEKNFGNLFLINNEGNENLNIENLYIKIYKKTKLNLDDFSKKIQDKINEDLNKNENIKKQKSYNNLSSIENQSISSKSSKTDLESLKLKSDLDNKEIKDEGNKQIRKQSKNKNKRKNKRQNKPIGMLDENKKENIIGGKKNDNINNNNNYINVKNNNQNINNKTNINIISKQNYYGKNIHYNNYYNNYEENYNIFNKNKFYPYKTFQRKNNFSYINPYQYKKYNYQNKFNFNNHYNNDLDELTNKENLKIEKNKIEKSPQKHNSNCSTPEKIINTILKDNLEEENKELKNSEFKLEDLNLDNSIFSENKNENKIDKEKNNEINKEEHFNFIKFFEGNKLNENEEEYESNLILSEEKEEFNDKIKDTMDGPYFNDILNNFCGKKLFDSNPFSNNFHKGKLDELNAKSIYIDNNLKDENNSLDED